MFQIIFIQFSYVFDLERNEDKKYPDDISIIALIIILTQKLDLHDALKGFRNMIYSLNGRCMMNARNVREANFVTFKISLYGN